MKSNYTTTEGNCMSFLSKGKTSGENDEEDIVKRQLTAIGGPESSDEPMEVSVELPESTDSGKPKQKTQPTAPEPAQQFEKRSVLQQGITVTGSITSESALFIYGVVDGDVSCESSVTIEGNVNGNILATEVQVLHGSIKGDIESQSDVNILKDAVVGGNIKCVSFTCDGEVNGNTAATGKALIKENAVIIGNITCAKISVGEGATLKGNLQTDLGATSTQIPNTVNDLPIDLKKYI